MHITVYGCPPPQGPLYYALVNNMEGCRWTRFPMMLFYKDVRLHYYEVTALTSPAVTITVCKR